MNRKNILIGVGGLVACLIAWQLVFWALVGRHMVTTDNAYVRADITMIAAKTEGFVRVIEAQENMLVAAGSPLITLDPRDTAASVAGAEADLARAQADAARARAEVRRVASDAQKMAAEAAASAATARQAGAMAQQAAADATSRNLSVTVAAEQISTQSDVVLQTQAALRAAEAASEVAALDRGRFAALASKGFVSQARMDQIDAQARAAAAKVAEARAAAAVSRQQVAVLSATRNRSASDAGSAGAGAAGARSGADGARARAVAAAAGAQSGQSAIGSAMAAVAAADAAVQAAQARLDSAKLGQGYANVTAPISGVVANRTVQIGQLVRPGAILMALVPLDQVYVVANFKETQIGKLRPGQPVTLKIDAFPDLKVTGKIDSVAPASGSQFSLLPTDTATGNFTKIVQRVPVRISIDPQWRARGLLRPGLSAEAKIDTRPQSKPADASAK